MSLRLFKVCVLFFLVSAGCGFSAAVKRNQASEEEKEKPTFTEKYSQKGKEEQEKIKHELFGGYSESARINPEGKWDFNIFGSFIYWEARENGLAVADMYDSHDATAILSHTQMDYEYKPGFKIGLGMNLGDHDNWVINAEYTRLHDSYSASMSIPSSEVWFDEIGPGFLSYQLISGYSFLSGSGTWTNDLDLIDLNLGRPFYSGEKLHLSPFIGMRGGWMDQKYDGAYTATTLSDTDTTYNFSSKSKQDSWLIGPRASLISDWNFAYGLRLKGSLAGGLYYQDFENTFTDYNITGLAYSTVVEPPSPKGEGFLVPSSGQPRQLPRL